MQHAVMQSCDVYFYRLANTLGIERIHDSMARMGFGEPTGIDIAGERGGIMPSPAWKKTAFSGRENQVWFPGRDRDRRHRPGLLDRDHPPAREGDRPARDARPALPAAPRARAGRSGDRRGRGEEAAAAAADRAQAPGELGDHRRRDGRGDERTARHAPRAPRAAPTYSIAGKTGTAQVFSVGQTEKYNEKDVAERLRDHALFVAFAPAEAPKLAIAVLVENGGFGSAAAAPIARAIFDAYLAKAPPHMMYGELGGSRTRRTVTGMARVLGALRLDGMLLSGLIAVSLFGLFVLWSAAGDNTSLWFNQLVRIGIGFALLIVLSQVPDHFLRMLSPAVYVLGLVLLVIVAFAGDIGKGAQRWLDLGLVRFQPSEIMKLAVPMMCAWYLHQRPLPPSLPRRWCRAPDRVPARRADRRAAGSRHRATRRRGRDDRARHGRPVTGLPAGQRRRAGRRGTARWRFLMHDYQRQRVLTLLDPQSDALGAGYHIIQSQIAIGSGGVFGKGWMNGSQAQLEFLPERSTDFIFAVIGEELGLLGLFALLLGYLFIVGRGLYMAMQCRDAFARLLAGSIALTFFVYACVNAGMVMGLLPVVGVPLPLVSYGGTSFVTLMAGFGILMSLHSSRKLVG